MSYWTEQTIVFKKEEEEIFLEQCKENEFELGNVVKVYDGKTLDNEDVVIYVFDANGDGPWYTGDVHLQHCYLYLEIYYGGGYGTLTECPDKKHGGVKETRYHLRHLLKKVIPAEYYADVVTKIGYTI